MHAIFVFETKNIKLINISIKNSLLSWIVKKRIYQIDQFILHPKKTQEDVLSSLIYKSKGTFFGIEHNFNKIKSYSDFSKYVPIRKYEEIFKYIKLTREGKKDILWPGKIKWYAISSGTTNSNRKYIPMTKASIMDCHLNAGKDMLSMYCNNFSSTNVFNGKGIMLGGSQNVKNDYVEGDLSAILLENLPFWVSIHSSTDVETLLIDDWENKLKKIADNAVRENITNLTGVPSWMLVLLKKIKEMSGVNDLTEIWPNLELFMHGGISFSPYKKQFYDLYPSSKLNYLEIYNASEGFFGIKNDFKKEDLLLMLDYGIFYEFIKKSDYVNERYNAIPLWEVEKNIEYAMIISTNSGLWRYLIGDTIIFTNTNPFKIKISGRIKSYINSFGEELIVDNAEKGISETCEIFNCKVNNYTAGPKFLQNGTGQHLWLIEFENKNTNTLDFEKALDTKLRQLNNDYNAKRFKSLVLKNLKIISLEKGTFYKWLKKNNKLGGQHKIPRLRNDDKLIKELLNI